MTTRQQWFDKQTPEVQKQFKENCDTLNPLQFFEFWINNDRFTKDIRGAFRWSDSKQGFEYWKKINDKYYDTTTIPQTTI